MDGIELVVRNVITSVLSQKNNHINVQDLSIDVNLRDSIGLESLEIAEIFVLLEEHFQKELNPFEVWNLSSISDFIKICS